VILITWGEPTSAGAAAGQSLVIIAALGVMLVGLLRCRPHKAEEGFHVVVDLYILCVAILQAIVSGLHAAVRLQGPDAPVALQASFTAAAYLAFLAAVGLLVTICVALLRTLHRLPRLTAGKEPSGAARLGA